jgi:dCMP deaminase
METARLWAHRGTCNRLRVGAVFSRSGRVLVQGYNGTPSGMLHCDHQNTEPCTRSVHAEANGIAWAARNGVSLDGAEVHLTDSPCPSCALLLINAGIVRVVYDREYRIKDGIELLREANLVVLRYDMIGS